MDNITVTSAVNYSSKSMAVIGLITFFQLTRTTAPYGRYSQMGWGFLIEPRLAWFIMESPNLLIPTVVILTENLSLPSTNIILLSCFIGHYLHRAIILPLNMTSGHGNAMPISVCALAFLFTSWNGFNQTFNLCFCVNYPSDWIYTLAFVMGMLIFALGMAVNVHADYTLLKLRSSGMAQVKSYTIPRGGLFEFVSCANYFGEVVEWTGFALACWSLPATAFALYTLCNLVPRAIAHHKWYKEKFKDEYPAGRKAVIPFLL